MLVLQKRHDWYEKLLEEVNATDARSFEWGSNDCAQFVARCVEAMTGVAPLPNYTPSASGRRRYTTASGVVKTLVKNDKIKTVRELMILCLGETTPISFAQRGNVVGYICEGEYAVGICLGHMSAFVTEGKGLAMIPTLEGEECWRIG